jgi:hypothetical protein
MASLLQSLAVEKPVALWTNADVVAWLEAHQFDEQSVQQIKGT